MNKLISGLFLLLVFVTVAQPANDNCSNATTLTSGAAALCNQTTNNATTQSGEVVNAGSVCASSNFNQSVWYNFTATSASMFIEWTLSSINGATWCPGTLSMAVYNASSCLPPASSIIYCESAASDGAIVEYLTGLTIGNAYKIQVGYNGGGSCKTPNFCIRLGNTPAQCSCSNVCAHGCGFSSSPTVSQVTSNCTQYTLTPVSDGGETHTYCYDFIASSSTVSFNMIINSNCSGGNVNGLTWTLQTNSCGANVATGTLSNMSASGLISGTTYVLCYTYTIPTSCYHSALTPYFVGATTPLPIELGKFYAVNIGDGNLIKWITDSEINNDYFTIERSSDGVSFETIAKVKGQGNSQEETEYTVEDRSFEHKVNYYRLTQTDFDGKQKTYDIVAVDNSISAKKVIMTVNLLGQKVQDDYHGIAIDIFEDGSTIKYMK